MAAIFYTIPDNGNSVFQGGITVNNSVHIPFLTNLINPDAMLIVCEVSIQNKDTVQYFLTFNDLVTFFYFGKGLGSLSISGLIAGSCLTSSSQFSYNGPTNYPGVDQLMNVIGNQLRGKSQQITFGNTTFWCVLSSFSFKASSESSAINFVEYNLQFEIVDHTLPSPVFISNC